MDNAGVPAAGLVDTDADITIMGPDLFKKVAAIAGLKKKHFRPVEKVPHTYDRHQFNLDGHLDLDISFVDKAMQTAIFVKMDDLKVFGHCHISPSCECTTNHYFCCRATLNT